MRQGSVETVFRALNDGQVRYLVVGGLAVVAHGFVRATADIDLVVQLEEENAARATQALGREGYRPLVPVPIESFADPAERKRWIREKGARVLQLYSDSHPTARVDLFLQEPFDFEEVRSRAAFREITADLRVPFLALDDLLEMKRAAARPQDLADVDRLERLQDLLSD